MPMLVLVCGRITLSHVFKSPSPVSKMSKRFRFLPVGLDLRGSIKHPQNGATRGGHCTRGFLFASTLLVTCRQSKLTIIE